MYVANDGSYIIKDQSTSIATDVYGEPIVTYPTNCFECDDLIAPVVAELISKGYYKILLPRSYVSKQYC